MTSVRPTPPFAVRLLTRSYPTRRLGPPIRDRPGEPASRCVRLTRLRGLGPLYDLVWATTWGAEANTFIGPVLGLPQLPVVAWPTTRDVRPDGTFWKTRHLVAHAEGRPFAWVDDDLDDTDRAFVASHHGSPALLHHVDARDGRRDTDFAVLDSFAHAL